MSGGGLSKHSPGPWRVCSASDGACQCGLIWSEPGDYWVAVADSTNEGDIRLPPDVYQANKRLIAAAPEMLEALRALLALHEGQPNGVGNWDAAFDGALAAVKKATVVP